MSFKIAFEFMRKQIIIICIKCVLKLSIHCSILNQPQESSSYVCKMLCKNLKNTGKNQIMTHFNEKAKFVRKFEEKLKKKNRKICML